MSYMDKLIRHFHAVSLEVYSIIKYLMQTSLKHDVNCSVHATSAFNSKNADVHKDAPGHKLLVHISFFANRG